MTVQHDGVELVGQVGIPETAGQHPAVMMMHSAHGLGEQVRERAQRLAGLGYVAVATDMKAACTTPIPRRAADP